VRFKSWAATCVAAPLIVSSAFAWSRRHAEMSRRKGPGGTELIDDRHGKVVECDFRGGARDGVSRVLVCENGLGAPLESWDWVVQELEERVGIIRYHRRGYARTTSGLRPNAIVTRLLEACGPDVRVSFITHSIGAVIAANSIMGDESLRDRTDALYILDGTDEDLLAADRLDPERVGVFRQTLAQEALASLTGLDRWTERATDMGVNYRASMQEAFLTTATTSRMLLAAYKEYLFEPVGGQRALAKSPMIRHVVSAGDNVAQQRALADRLRASFSVVDGSTHKSLVGRLGHVRAALRALEKEGVVW
jgi:pimeloyl-ACP methyl ester carboxylesterase